MAEEHHKPEKTTKDKKAARSTTVSNSDSNSVSKSNQTSVPNKPGNDANKERKEPKIDLHHSQLIGAGSLLGARRRVGVGRRGRPIGALLQLWHNI